MTDRWLMPESLSERLAERYRTATYARKTRIRAMLLHGLIEATYWIAAGFIFGLSAYVGVNIALAL